MCTEDTQGPPIFFEPSIYHQAYHQSYHYLRPLDESGSPGDDSENLDFVAPLDEHRLYGIFCFFDSLAFIFKTLPLLKCVLKTL